MSTTKVQSAMIDDNAITSALIATDAITTAKMADNAVTLAKLAHGTASQNIAYDGSGIPVDVAITSGATSAEATNIMLNAFRISVNGGLTAKNMVDGVVDEFEDGTGIDASTSTNETLVAGTTTTTPVSSDWTGRGSGNSYATGSVTCTSSGSTYTTLALLKGDFTFQFDFSASSLVSDHTVIGIYATGEDATAGGYQQAGMDIMTNSFYTSPGSPWIKKGSSTVHSSSWANTSDTYQIRRVGTTISIYNVSDGTTEYTWSGSYTGNYHAAIGGGGSMTIDDIEIKGFGIAHITNSGANMDLFSNATTALAVPTDANIVIRQEDGSSAITLNTDLKAYASRNGGTTYTQMTLAEEASLTTGRILTGAVDISGQSSATAMKYKITTHNTKEQKIHAVALQWS